MRVSIRVSLFAVFMLSCGASAATIVDQPLDPDLPGGYSNLDLNGRSAQQVADDFSLPAPGILDSISWQGRYGSGQVQPANPVAFAIRFFHDDGGAPSLPVVASLQELTPAIDAADTGQNFSGATWFTYQAALPSIALPAGKYWVSIVESDTRTATMGDGQWLWGISDNRSTTRAFRGEDSEAWSITGSNAAWNLTGTIVPEPEAIALLALGVLGGLALVGKHRLL